jgi:cytochrome o ubiquinol oxidase subunit IV
VHINSHHTLPPDEILIPILLIVAILQLIVQLIFFLHLIHESKPRWNLLFFISTIGIILIMIIGGIWIMNHLNYNMTPQKVNQYIQNEDAF